MNDNFYIVDDDESIRRVLKKIIIDHNLGDVLGDAGEGLKAISEIKKYNPDIVLVDLLLPSIDGITLVSKLKEEGFGGVFIMISQVSSKDMISKAYKMGIEFYIHKPINVVEVISVIKNVKEKINMSTVIKSVERAMKNINYFAANKAEQLNQTTDEIKINKILTQLGIMGETGTSDIIEMINLILERNRENGGNLEPYRLSDIYKMLSEKYERKYGKSSNVGAIEQRIRRTVYKALQNIASLGIEDYSNEIFQKYSTSLFDFEEVRKQMNQIKGSSMYGGKINVKKFVEGIIAWLKSDELEI